MHGHRLRLLAEEEHISLCWKLPLGSLVVVDDADRAAPEAFSHSRMLSQTNLTPEQSRATIHTFWSSPPSSHQRHF